MNKAILLLPVIACLMTTAALGQQSQGLTQTLKCKDPTAHKYTCVLVISISHSPTHTLNYKDKDNKTRIVVIREEDDSDKPTVIIINCFTGCVDQENQRATISNTIISA